MPCELKSQRLNMNGASISNHFHIFLRTERNKYYKHNIKARVNPNKYLSLIIDGMDQAKHNLPHFTTSTKVKSMLLVHVLNIILECFRILKAPVIRSSLRKKLTLSKHRCWVVPHKHQHCTISHWHNSSRNCIRILLTLQAVKRNLLRCLHIIAFHFYVFSSGRRRCVEIKDASHRCSG